MSQNRAPYTRNERLSAFVRYYRETGNNLTPQQLDIILEDAAAIYPVDVHDLIGMLIEHIKPKGQ